MIKLSWIGDIIVLSTEPLIIILLLAKQMWTSPAQCSICQIRSCHPNLREVNIIDYIID